MSRLHDQNLDTAEVTDLKVQVHILKQENIKSP